jgi:hypothetical protein
MDSAPEKFLVGFEALAAFLTDEGYPTARQTITKYCSPAINIGPPREGNWGKLPMFSPTRALEWARARAGLNEHAA